MAQRRRFRSNEETSEVPVPDMAQRRRIRSSEETSKAPAPDIAHRRRLRSSEEDNNNVGHICCLMDDGVRCTELASTSSYTYRTKKDIKDKDLKMSYDPASRHSFMCDWHVGVITLTPKLPRRTAAHVPDVNLNCLSESSLQRYKEFFNIQTDPSMSKAKQAEVLTKHFKTTPVNERETIAFFCHKVKKNGNKLD